MKIREIVVISGKGGTGKTSLTASFSALAKNAVLADCDVDAADLHLLLQPEIISTTPFSAGKTARIRAGHCEACGKCAELCRFDAIYYDGPGNGRHPKTFRVDPLNCEGCGVCVWFCDYKAILLEETRNGKWFISRTRNGWMVHAVMYAGAENSGKMVTLLREQARKLAEEHGKDLIIVDGSPGIGCPVISSITGADLIVLVTEPTLSGIHDLKRVAELASHFEIPVLTVVNKWDINPERTAEIEKTAAELKLEFAGKIGYDKAVTQAQLEQLSVVECGAGKVAEEIRLVWDKILKRLNQ